MAGKHLQRIRAGAIHVSSKNRATLDSAYTKIQTCTVLRTRFQSKLFAKEKSDNSIRGTTAINQQRPTLVPDFARATRPLRLSIAPCHGPPSASVVGATATLPGEVLANLTAPPPSGA